MRSRRCCRCSTRPPSPTWRSTPRRYGKTPSAALLAAGGVRRWRERRSDPARSLPVGALLDGVRAKLEALARGMRASGEEEGEEGEEDEDYDDDEEEEEEAEEEEEEEGAEKEG